MKSCIAIIRKGIIENHDELRTMLRQKGCQTNSEIVVHVLSKLYNDNILEPS